MSRLVDFLKDMGSDAAVADEFERNPDAVMDRYDLTDQERAAVRSGDAEQVKSLSGLDDVRMTNTTIKAY